MLKLGGLLALATHHKILNRALSDDRLSAMALGQKSAEAVLDRAMGKPTERHDVRGVQTVIFTGIDPSLLPAAKSAGDGTLKPALPKPSLPPTRREPDKS